MKKFVGMYESLAELVIVLEVNEEDVAIVKSCIEEGWELWNEDNDSLYGYEYYNEPVEENLKERNIEYDDLTVDYEAGAITDDEVEWL